ncbi:Uncharacterised protein [uncultured archaeon]|nr:Uncharacterised protein [uncultured archaeon]
MVRRILGLSLIFFISIGMILPALANEDATGTWQSIYIFGPVKETMPANIQQIGEDLLGSFSVMQSPSGDQYSGILFGTVVGDKIKVYYLSVREKEGKDPAVAITFAEGQIADENTIKGTYYYQNSDSVSLSGPYEAIRA